MEWMTYDSAGAAATVSGAPCPATSTIGPRLTTTHLRCRAHRMEPASQQQQQQEQRPRLPRGDRATAASAGLEHNKENAQVAAEDSSAQQRRSPPTSQKAAAPAIGTAAAAVAAAARLLASRPFAPSSPQHATPRMDTQLTQVTVRTPTTMSNPVDYVHLLYPLAQQRCWAVVQHHAHRPVPNLPPGYPASAFTPVRSTPLPPQQQQQQRDTARRQRQAAHEAALLSAFLAAATEEHSGTAEPRAGGTLHRRHVRQHHPSAASDLSGSRRGCSHHHRGRPAWKTADNAPGSHPHIRSATRPPSPSLSVGVGRVRAVVAVPLDAPLVDPFAHDAPAAATNASAAAADSDSERSPSAAAAERAEMGEAAHVLPRRGARTPLRQSDQRSPHHDTAALAGDVAPMLAPTAPSTTGSVASSFAARQQRLQRMMFAEHSEPLPDDEDDDDDSGGGLGEGKERCAARGRLSCLRETVHEVSYPQQHPPQRSLSSSPRPPSPPPPANHFSPRGTPREAAAPWRRGVPSPASDGPSVEPSLSPIGTRWEESVCLPSRAAEAARAATRATAARSLSPPTRGSDSAESGARRRKGSISALFRGSGVCAGATPMSRADSADRAALRQPSSPLAPPHSMAGSSSQPASRSSPSVRCPRHEEATRSLSTAGSANCPPGATASPSPPPITHAAGAVGRLLVRATAADSPSGDMRAATGAHPRGAAGGLHEGVAAVKEEAIGIDEDGNVLFRRRCGRSWSSRDTNNSPPAVAVVVEEEEVVESVAPRVVREVCSLERADTETWIGAGDLTRPQTLAGEEGEEELFSDALPTGELSPGPASPSTAVRVTCCYSSGLSAIAAQARMGEDGLGRSASSSAAVAHTRQQQQQQQQQRHGQDAEDAALHAETPGRPWASCECSRVRGSLSPRGLAECATDDALHLAEATGAETEEVAGEPEKKQDGVADAAVVHTTPARPSAQPLASPLFLLYSAPEWSAAARAQSQAGTSVAQEADAAVTAVASTTPTTVIPAASRSLSAAFLAAPLDSHDGARRVSRSVRAASVTATDPLASTQGSSVSGPSSPLWSSAPGTGGAAAARGGFSCQSHASSEAAATACISDDATDAGGGRLSSLDQSEPEPRPHAAGEAGSATYSAAASFNYYLAVMSRAAGGQPRNSTDSHRLSFSRSHGGSGTVNTTTVGGSNSSSSIEQRPSWAPVKRGRFSCSSPTRASQSQSQPHARRQLWRQSLGSSASLAASSFLHGARMSIHYSTRSSGRSSSSSGRSSFPGAALGDAFAAAAVASFSPSLQRPSHATAATTPSSSSNALTGSSERDEGEDVTRQGQSQPLNRNEGQRVAPLAAWGSLTLPTAAQRWSSTAATSPSPCGLRASSNGEGSGGMAPVKRPKGPPSPSHAGLSMQTDAENVTLPFTDEDVVSSGGTEPATAGAVATLTGRWAFDSAASSAPYPPRPQTRVPSLSVAVATMLMASPPPPERAPWSYSEFSSVLPHIGGGGGALAAAAAATTPPSRHHVWADNELGSGRTPDPVCDDVPLVPLDYSRRSSSFLQRATVLTVAPTPSSAARQTTTPQGHAASPGAASSRGGQTPGLAWGETPSVAGADWRAHAQQLSRDLWTAHTPMPLQDSLSRSRRCPPSLQTPFSTTAASTRSPAATMVERAPTRGEAGEEEEEEEAMLSAVSPQITRAVFPALTPSSRAAEGDDSGSRSGPRAPSVVSGTTPSSQQQQQQQQQQQVGTADRVSRSVVEGASPSNVHAAGRAGVLTPLVRAIFARSVSPCASSRKVREQSLAGPQTPLITSAQTRASSPRAVAVAGVGEEDAAEAVARLHTPFAAARGSSVVLEGSRDRLILAQTDYAEPEVVPAALLHDVHPTRLLADPAGFQSAGAAPSAARTPPVLPVFPRRDGPACAASAARLGYHARLSGSSRSKSQRRSHSSSDASSAVSSAGALAGRRATRLSDRSHSHSHSHSACWSNRGERSHSAPATVSSGSAHADIFCEYDAGARRSTPSCHSDGQAREPPAPSSHVRARTVSVAPVPEDARSKSASPAASPPSPPPARAASLVGLRMVRAPDGESPARLANRPVVRTPSTARCRPSLGRSCAAASAATRSEKRPDSMRLEQSPVAGGGPFPHASSPRGGLGGVGPDGGISDGLGTVNLL